MVNSCKCVNKQQKASTLTLNRLSKDPEGALASINYKNLDSAPEGYFRVCGIHIVIGTHDRFST